MSFEVLINSSKDAYEIKLRKFEVKYDDLVLKLKSRTSKDEVNVEARKKNPSLFYENEWKYTIAIDI